MSENIVHTAVTDDCARLSIQWPRICEAFKGCFRRHLDVARLGGVTRSGGNHTLVLLGRFRKAWPNRVEGDGLEEKMAFVLGWHTHRAADLQMKPVFETADAGCPLSPTDCSIYQDVFLFRTIYRGGQVEPYQPATLESQTQSSTALKGRSPRLGEAVMRSLWQQQVLGLHRLARDGQMSDSALKKLLAARQPVGVDLDRYEQAFRDPDPAKVKRFITEINFYNPEDSLIRLARSLQRDRGGARIDLDKALQAAASQSHYAQALRRGCIYLQAASDYFEGRIDEETYKDLLERGKQGIG